MPLLSGPWHLMAKKSAGLLMYRTSGGALEVLLVHSGGPYWANRFWQAWSIPKGEIDPGEDPFAAAQREFHEETGQKPEGQFHALQPVRQAGASWYLPGPLRAILTPLPYTATPSP